MEDNDTIFWRKTILLEVPFIKQPSVPFILSHEYSTEKSIEPNKASSSHCNTPNMKTWVSNEPIIAKSKYLLPIVSAAKHVRASYNDYLTLAGDKRQK